MFLIKQHIGVTNLRITHVQQLSETLAQLVYVGIGTIAARGGAERADAAGGGQRGDGAGGTGAHHLAAALGERQQRVVDLLHGLLVVSSPLAGWIARIHVDCWTSLLAHAGPRCAGITSHRPGRLLRTRPTVRTWLEDEDDMERRVQSRKELVL